MTKEETQRRKAEQRIKDAAAREQGASNTAEAGDRAQSLDERVTALEAYLGDANLIQRVDELEGRAQGIIDAIGPLEPRVAALEAQGKPIDQGNG